MKIAVLSDIHANFVALTTAVDHLEPWKPDYVIVAGDLVNRGPRPMECLRLIQEKSKTENWLTVRGNHEDYVISQANPLAPHSGPAFEVHRASFWTYQQLNGDISALRSMPFQQSLQDPDGNEIRFVHASMTGNRDGIYPETTDEALVHKVFPPGIHPSNSPLALFCVGHTHRPLIRNLNGVLIINAGSTGLPFDGDKRLSYARLTWKNGLWNAEIVRLKYNIAKAEHDFITSGYIEGGGPLVRLVQVELQTASSQLYNWAVKYQEPARKGEISMRDSVHQYLCSIQ
jgi:predicted phosphodiesterase